MKTYTYSITTDTQNSKINSFKLKKEIENSIISVTLDRIDTIEDTISVVFTAELSESEETTLDGLIGTHDGEPKPVEEIPQTVQVDNSVPIHTYALAEGNSLRARLVGMFNQNIIQNQTSNLDWQIPQVSYLGVNKQTYMNGITYFAKNAEVGDHITFQVVDKDGLVYPAGTVLDEFGSEWGVVPDQFIDLQLYKAKLISGFYLRLVYHSVGTTENIKFICNLYRHLDRNQDT